MFEFVKEAFNRQSKIFDEYEKQNEILKRMREVVRGHLLRHLKKGEQILELNAGTGIDAVYLAEKGFNIHAIDISEGMMSKLESKVKSSALQHKITFELISFTELNNLKIKSFDYIFSNFGGLNCVKNLSEVTKHFNQILKQGGKITLVIMPPVCLWEIALALKGKYKSAFRRFNNNGTLANIEEIKFYTYYHSFKKLRQALGRNFKLIELQGLAAISPPPYAENFPKQHPLLYEILCRVENLLSHIFPFNRCADHYIATFEFIPK